MSKFLSLAFFVCACVAGFSQNLPFDTSEAIHIQRTNLTVRWKASKHPWPGTLWTYKVVPTRFSPSVISNLLALEPFAGQQKRDYGDNGFLIGNLNGSPPNLRVSFVAGEIEYNGSERHYSATNLSWDVPGTNRLFQLTTNFLPKLGISLSDVARRENGQPKIGWYASDHTEYLTANGTVTNVEYRTVWVSRALDGVEYPGPDTDCRISFGEHAKVVKIWMHWHSVEREKQYAAATPENVAQWIREGRAIQRPIVTTSGGPITTVDWSTVKSLTITKATANYFGNSMDLQMARKPLSSSRVRPDAWLSGIVDTGKEKINIEIICPVIDESKPLK
jgi:hypothetical protein